MKVIVY